MPEIEVKVGDRVINFVVNEAELETATAAAESLQAAINIIDGGLQAAGSTSEKLLLAGIDVASQLKETNVELQTLKKETKNALTPLAQEQVESADQIKALEELAQKTSYLANQLESILATTKTLPQHAL